MHEPHAANLRPRFRIHQPRAAARRRIRQLNHCTMKAVGCMSGDRSRIAAAKQRLPLPELMRCLALRVPVGGTGNIESPFYPERAQKTPSFSIFFRNGAYGWCDRTGGQEIKGDEITFLERFEGLSRADAIRRYLNLAGIDVESDKRPKPNLARQPLFRVLDWPAMVDSFKTNHAQQLAISRGFSIDFVQWLRMKHLIGIWNGNFAFPVHNSTGCVLAAHVRTGSGRWFYFPKGAGSRPLIIGDLQSSSKTMVFESQ